jgi:HSP20 family protein
MINLDLWKNERNTSGSVINDIWGVLDNFDRGFLVPFPSRNAPEKSLMPACDIVENDGAFLLSLDVPGLKKEDINIELTGRQLTISGERKHEEESTQGNVHRIERSYGKFQRIFELPNGANTEVVEASYDNGVLKIAIPKVESVMPKKIQISEGDRGLLKRQSNKQEAKLVNS